MKIFNANKTRFISHRGFTPLAPENSLPSFYYAGLLGQWAIETDVHVTKDGEIVCCHNDSIDEYCNGAGKISELSYKELRNFEIIKGNRVECLKKEELKIPSFSEYLSICKQFGSVPFIELKTDDAEYVMHRLRKDGFADDEVVISSTELSRLIQTRQCAPNTFIHWIFVDESRVDELCSLKNAGCSLKISNPFDCDEGKIKAIHDKGLKICLRAADDVSGLARMKELKLDYFPTNKMHDKQ